jgi:hypothetical protein
MQRAPTKRASAVVAAALTVLAFATTAAYAELLVEEQFDYELGSLIDGQDGGLGFDGPWSASKSHGRDYKMEFEGLTFTDAELEELPAAGNSLSRFGSAGRAEAHRLLSEDAQALLTADDTTMWFGVLFQEPGPPYLHTSFLFGTYKFSTQGTPILGDGDDDRSPPFVPVDGDGFGFTIQAAPDGSIQGTGTINALAFSGSYQPIVVEGTYFPDPQTATSLIVGKINWGAAGDPDELFLFNVTYMSSEPEEEEAFASIVDLDLDQAAFNTVAVWDSNNGRIDEIRFGTTFFDVVGMDMGPSVSFLRGDANADGDINITDGIFVLNYLFLGGAEPPCLEAADSNDDDEHNITDGIFVLNYLFLGGSVPPAPGPEQCGPDPSADGGMGCATPPERCR